MQDLVFLQVGNNLINLEKIVSVNLAGFEEKVVINFQDKENYQYFRGCEAEALRKFFRGETEGFKVYRIIKGCVIDVLPGDGKS